MNISAVKTVIVDFLCSVIFFCKREIVHIIAIPYCEEWNKGHGAGSGTERSVVWWAGVWGCSVPDIPS